MPCARLVQEMITLIMFSFYNVDLKLTLNFTLV